MALADEYAFPSYDLNRESRWTSADVTFGSSAIASSFFPSPNYTITRTGAGAYNLTFPAAPKTRISFGLFSPAKTAQNMIVTALNSTAGTASIVVTNNAGTNTDPATNDILWLFFEGEARS